ncbi:hypothetical protein TNCV_660181 [Trichonephila clavipes]|nr:hypothetical protein TNCV_660181 [Trichonephila clavipes]
MHIWNPENIGTHFFATAVEKNVQQTVAAAMTIVTTCNFTFRSHPPLFRKPRLSIYTGDVLVTSSTVMLWTLKNGTAALGNHSFSQGRSGKTEKPAVLMDAALAFKVLRKKIYKLQMQK